MPHSGRSTLNNLLLLGAALSGLRLLLAYSLDPYDAGNATGWAIGIAIAIAVFSLLSNRYQWIHISSRRRHYEVESIKVLLFIAVAIAAIGGPALFISLAFYLLAFFLFLGRGYMQPDQTPIFFSTMIPAAVTWLAERSMHLSDNLGLSLLWTVLIFGGTWLTIRLLKWVSTSAEQAGHHSPSA
jgi:hypothetical protein